MDLDFFAGGLLTSLGPCSLSLLPITLAYLAGFQGDGHKPALRVRKTKKPRGFLGPRG